MSDFDAFLAAKLSHEPPRGIDHVPVLPSALFPFQRDAVTWALRTGRAALFEDCGLGKTLQQLSWAHAVRESTGSRVLILAPLGVALQTVREGARFGLPVAYHRNGDDASNSGVVITNYEMAEHFRAEEFDAVVLDESSILKSYMGATKRELVESWQRTRFRLACTATPAPNDVMELGNHSEFLGILPSSEMLARWFVADQSGMGKYRIRGHAVDAYWDWVSSWARCIGKPSDIGPYSDDGYIMPELRVHTHQVDVDLTVGRAAGHLFRAPDMSATSLHREKRISVDARAAKVAELVTSEPGEQHLVWCETDYEADALKAVLPDATEVRGSHKFEAKERAALGFADGTVRVLIAKPKMFGYGMNWQNCARVHYVGASYSYEMFYQSVRRCWRFGQRRPVDAHVVMATTEVDVWARMQEKARQHETMKGHMFEAMRRARERVEARYRAYDPRVSGKLPAWLK